VRRRVSIDEEGLLFNCTIIRDLVNRYRRIDYRGSDRVIADSHSISANRASITRLRRLVPVAANPPCGLPDTSE